MRKLEGLVKERKRRRVDDLALAPAPRTYGRSVDLYDSRFREIDEGNVLACEVKVRFRRLSGYMYVLLDQSTRTA